jgi:hypothetical protein
MREIKLSEQQKKEETCCSLLLAQAIKIEFKRI